MKVADCLLVSVPENLSIHNHLMVSFFVFCCWWGFFSFSGSMVGVKFDCVVIWMYAVMSMRGNPQYIDSSVCRAGLEECIQRGRLISYTWRIQEKKENFEFSKKTVMILWTEAKSTWKKTLESC